MSDLINYNDSKLPIRIAHAVDTLSEVHRIEKAVENNGADGLRKPIESQIERRKRIMKGLDQEIKKLEELLQEEGENR